MVGARPCALALALAPKAGTQTFALRQSAGVHRGSGVGAGIFLHSRRTKSAETDNETGNEDQAMALTAKSPEQLKADRIVREAREKEDAEERLLAQRARMSGEAYSGRSARK